ncbi:hypothetical protein PHSY_006348 [Pseudozyma hubeiensis SY62]|uniref:Uncharacterized protein n=1 Tax=Pseudozyma hubeiensis (strain SY62) TaxID=1305764 RepID=R9PBN2_PSEHS|nr:hypothetical protein PHSY_006348 [Pseudozyma hubeiensis SY62]GAC98754.1 hypothetical protein PHSY_006348 [Pseudozyma hubeiensis SY62]
MQRTSPQRRTRAGFLPLAEDAGGLALSSRRGQHDPPKHHRGRKDPLTFRYLRDSEWKLWYTRGTANEVQLTRNVNFQIDTKLVPLPSSSTRASKVTRITVMTGEFVTSTSDDAASGGPSDSHLRSGMTIDEQLIKAEQLKSLGNKAYEQDVLTEALKQWHHSLLYCAGINSFASLYGARSTDVENERAAAIAGAVYNNMAACYLRQSKWEKAVYAASKALSLVPDNLKALYRRGEAYLELGRNQLAARDIDTALDLRPQDPVIRKLGERLVQAFEDEEMHRQLDTARDTSA